MANTQSPSSVFKKLEVHGVYGGGEPLQLAVLLSPRLSDEPQVQKAFSRFSI